MLQERRRYWGESQHDLAYLWGAPRPSHLFGLYDVSQVPIREDPAVERGRHVAGWFLTILGQAEAPPPCCPGPPTLTAAPGKWTARQKTVGCPGVSRGSSSGLQPPVEQRAVSKTPCPSMEAAAAAAMQGPQPSEYQAL